MAQQQVLEHEVVARPRPGQHGREQQPEQIEHAFSIADPRHARICRRYLESERGALWNGGAESVHLPSALGRRCGDKAPHLRDHPGRTVAEAAEPACTGVTGGVRAFLGQSTPALETVVTTRTFGVDSSARWFDVAHAEQVRRFANTSRGSSACLAWVATFGTPVRVGWRRPAPLTCR